VNCAFSYQNLTAAFQSISCSRAIRGVVFFPGEQIVKIRLVAFSTVLFLGDIEFTLVDIADPGSKSTKKKDPPEWRVPECSELPQPWMI
jgi:hypothetical protein